MSASKNNIFEITSFLSGSNVAYIKEMYEKFSSNPESVPASWREYFAGLGENKDLITQDTKSASWQPKKLKKKNQIVLQKN